MIFDTPQQKEMLANIIQLVQINAPIQVAQQQIQQIMGLLQEIMNGEIKPPDGGGKNE